MAGKKSKKKQVHLKTPFSASKPTPPNPPACNPEEGLRATPPGELACDSSPAHPNIDAPVKMCRHLERGVNIDKLSSQLSKSKFSLTHCQECAKDSKSGTGKKGKGRSNRKKAGAVIGHSAGHLQKKWVCLTCGHVACGALSTHSNKRPEEPESNMENYKDSDNNPTGHAFKHSHLAKHPLSLQATDSLVCWCFMCNMAVDFTVSSGTANASLQLASSISDLQAAVKFVHEKLVKETGLLKDPGKSDFTGDPVRCNVDDASQSSSTYVLHPSSPMSMHMIGTRRKRTVKGLMNLGNTCFFNSVMQNLLALDMLRDYFSRELPDSEGPLTSSLRKLYLETNLDGGGHLSTDASGHESGLKRGGKGRAVWEGNGGACNPRSLFGAICAKAPRFRGFQQQDSHELLRCLLDGLTSEERSARSMSTCNAHSKKGLSALAADRALMPNGDCSNSEPLEEEKECRSLESKSTPSVVTTTFVESFFGGQLCSTVRCCECGHSSVVYETMLDLSLQIPTRPTLRKGQKSASQWKPSSFGGGSQQRNNKHTKVPPIARLQNVPNAASLAEVETNKSSLKVGIAAQGGQTYTLSDAGASSPKLLLTENSALDDFGWMDFIGGGIQSAESSIQGSCDVPNSSETSENNLVVDVEDTIGGNALKTALHPSTYDEKGSRHEIKADIGVPEDASDSAMPCAGTQGSKLCFEQLSADTPKKSPEQEDEKTLEHSEGEDGPLPLASGIMLLPYEPLEMSSTMRGEESIESAVNGSTVDVLNPPLEPEGGYLDGFSQLFEEEEEESCSAASQNIKSSGGNLDNYQVIEESPWDDGSWEADAPVYGPQRLADYEDAVLPMSLESCLADFTKPELLCGENAWECESCTRRLKEKAHFVKITDNLVSTEDMYGGGDLEKTVTELQGRQDVTCITSSTGGNSPQDDCSNSHLMSCTENKSTDQAFPEGCKGLSGGFNESMSDSPSVCAGVDHNTEENQNGSAHLTELDGGQLCGSQSPLCEVDSNSDVMENQHINERIADMPKPEQNNKSGNQESAVNKNLRSLASDPSGKNEAQGDCSGRECALPVALPKLNGEKLMGPLSKSNKEAKVKTTSRQHPEKLVKKDATKKLSISKAPPILTVHLKRFAQDMRGRLSKLSGHVTFPEILDLQPFLDPRCLNSNSCYYQLVGIVEHGGTMRGGHYIAYVRSPVVEETSDSTEHENKDFWFCISDSSVRKSSLQAVLSSEAYLLFYEKCTVKKED